VNSTERYTKSKPKYSNMTNFKWFFFLLEFDIFRDLGETVKGLICSMASPRFLGLLKYPL